MTHLCGMNRCRSDPSWFGFMLRVRPGSPFSTNDLAVELAEKKIGHRRLLLAIYYVNQPF